MDMAVSDHGAAGNRGEGSSALPADARPLAIEARGLVKSFDGTRAVDGVDILVPEGAIYGILGPNGAGKTTTLRMLLGIIDPDEGVRRVFGHDRPHDIGRLIGYLPEERGLYPAMKCIEAIAFMGALRGLDWSAGRKRAAAMLEQAGLGLLRHLDGVLDVGERQGRGLRMPPRRLMMAAALDEQVEMHRPRHAAPPCKSTNARCVMPAPG